LKKAGSRGSQVLPNWEWSVSNGAKRRQGRFIRDRVCALKLLCMNRFTHDRKWFKKAGKRREAGVGKRERRS